MKAGWLFPNLASRADIPELMDDPSCDEATLLRTVAGFRSLNRWLTRYRSVLKKWILSDMLAAPKRKYVVADLGAGGCDIAVWLLDACRRLDLDVRVLAIEGDSRIAAYARRFCDEIPGLRVLEADATDLSAIDGADYVIGNHFLHHLRDAELERILKGLAAMSLRRFVFNDLRRSYWAYWFHAVAASAVFPRTFAARDGCRSIRRGFKVGELRALVKRIGLAGRVKIMTMTPARVLLVSV